MTSRQKGNFLTTETTEITEKDNFILHNKEVIKFFLHVPNGQHKS